MLTAIHIIKLETNMLIGYLIPPLKVKWSYPSTLIKFLYFRFIYERGTITNIISHSA